jgi:hypothetical protein
MIDREIQRDQKIRGWLGCLPVLVAGCVSLAPVAIASV